MIQRFCQLDETINKLLGNHSESNTPPLITGAEKCLMNECKQLLSIFDEITNEATAEK